MSDEDHRPTVNVSNLKAPMELIYCDSGVDDNSALLKVKKIKNANSSFFFVELLMWSKKQK